MNLIIANCRGYNMLTVYSKANCPFCDQAKHYLKINGFEFDEVRVDMDTTAREWIVSQGIRTVPQIYYNQQLFVDGGFQGLSKMVPDQIQQRIGALNVST